MRRTIFATTCCSICLLTWGTLSAGAAGFCRRVVSGFAEVNGANLYYEEKGCGEPVVLLHGLTLDTRMWDFQFDRLSRKYRAIRYDAQGHGQSDGMFGPVSHVENLRGLLSFLEIDSAHIVGLSMGGTTVCDFALAYPGMVRSLAILDAAPSGFPFPFDPGGFADRLNVIGFIQLQFGFEASLLAWLADPLFAPANTIPNVKRKLEEIVLVGHAALGEGAGFTVPNFFNVIGIDPPAFERVEDISSPTLVLVGELDIPEFQDAAAVLNTRIPGARLETVLGAGHMSNMERPFLVNAFLLEFLAQNENEFIRGDVNSNGAVEFSDALYLLHTLFRSPVDPPCVDAADVDDDGAVRLGDAMVLLRALFFPGFSIASPYPDCGPDPTQDELNCTDYPPCQ